MYFNEKDIFAQRLKIQPHCGEISVHTVGPFMTLRNRLMTTLGNLVLKVILASYECNILEWEH